MFEMYMISYLETQFKTSQTDLGYQADSLDLTA